VTAAAPPLRTLLVDDEAPARAKLRRLVAAAPRLAVVGEAASGTEALERITALAPDLVFLDVQMPGGTGFDVLEALPEAGRPLVIFSTAYDAFALRAFDVAAVDYLLKPYDEPRFQAAVARAAQRAAGAGSAGASLTSMSPAAASLAGGEAASDPSASLAAPPAGLPRLLAEVRQQPLERLLVRDGEAWLAVRLDTVHRLESQDKHVRVHSAAGVYLVRQPLRSLEARLDPRRFVRVHRGELVRLDAVARLEPWTHGDSILTLADGATVVLSRTYRDEFLARWQR
jgi:two-component system LytT family response regulator